MKNLILLLLSTICFSCIDAIQNSESKDNLPPVTQKSILDATKNTDSLPEAKGTFDSIATGLNFKSKGNYKQTNQSIEQARVSYNKAYINQSDPVKKDTILKEASAYFTKAILNDIIPYWYGTEWDFNGHTNIPNEGEIACGYFVSTTLKHMGIQLNRYTMAQQASKLEVESIAIQKNKTIFFNLKNSIEQLQQLKDGLYIIGLDNHVGYIYNLNSSTYFIHSSYITDRVMIEPADQSEAFPSNVYYLASITDNKPLIKKWILGQRLSIKTQ
ncbi:hypothetical protein GCM10022393_05190 [Aquimarina addita]|uniref:Uncharacterized protein n=1 Tax=Aquimarina addita TaxID=870485 RepID=A0ABP7XA28_9FLAO